MLSTAMFEGAVARTRPPRATCWRTISTRTVVLPVPGGPWTTAASSAQSARLTASCWYSLRSRLKKTTFVARERSGTVSPRNTSRRVDKRERRDSQAVARALRMRW
mgnify:CR=1 FL=1